MIRIFLTALFLLLLAAAAVSDLKERRIPDAVSGAVALLGIAAVWWMPEPGIWQRLAGMLAVSVPVLLLALVRQGAFGGGDIKLLAAGGLFLGGEAIGEAFLIGMTGAGLWGLFLLIRGKGRKEKFALGPFLCMGMAIRLFSGEFLWN